MFRTARGAVHRSFGYDHGVWQVFYGRGVSLACRLVTVMYGNSAMSLFWMVAIQSWRVAPVDGYWSPALLILPMRSRVLAYLPHCRYGLASEQ